VPALPREEVQRRARAGQGAANACLLAGVCSLARVVPGKGCAAVLGRSAFRTVWGAARAPAGAAGRRAGGRSGGGARELCCVRRRR